MMDMGDMMARCMDMMGSTMDGGMMGSGLLLVILIALLALWLVGLATVGVLWASGPFGGSPGRDTRPAAKE